jgi:hypothetical protein
LEELFLKTTAKVSAEVAPRGVEEVTFPRTTGEDSHGCLREQSPKVVELEGWKVFLGAVQRDALVGEAVAQKLTLGPVQARTQQSSRCLVELLLLVEVGSLR